MKIRQIILPSLLLSGVTVSADIVAHFPMDVKDGEITDVVSGQKSTVEGNFVPENLPGAVGEALRFDGYTSKVTAVLGELFPAGSTQLTMSAWVALPCYPIIQIDTDTKEQTAIVSCLDEENKTGFGFYVGFDGKYSFRSYIGGWPVDIQVDSPLPVYQWNHLVAVVDCAAKKAVLYNNGEEVGSSKCTGSFGFAGGNLYMGQSKASRKSGPFELMSFNGLIDDVKIWNEALPVESFASERPENLANLDIPASRFSEDLLRPHFHGMPAAGWTNECHGMWYSDGKYHLFFQKNADGPYMARLHWGHITSENLCEWQGEPIAIAPGESYDIKGCWSGCVFADDEITGGEPNILYTAVDYAKATIAQAAPKSEDLIEWTKSPRNPIISGRPQGLSDDFRDPYFFRNGDNAYIIVGSSKNGVGTTTLHKYQGGNWSNTGDLFFTGTSVGQDGKFWEMPNITEMSDGNWLFTATPLETSTGVHTLYWTGSIDGEGHFVPSSNSATPKNVELISKDGFGLLSPTIYKHDEKVIALGIVPDKLPSSTNWKLGWAHCYSLPREWSLNSEGVLVQKPYEGLKDMRSDANVSFKDCKISDVMPLDGVSGRRVEMLGQFQVGASAFGFKFFKGATGEATIKYVPSSNELVIDFTQLRRLVNDNGVYDGIYRAVLPERLAEGSEMKMNVFIDGSIVDVFINDRWATSVRVFPTEADADGVEVFSEGGEVHASSIDAWVLKSGSIHGGVSLPDADSYNPSKIVDVYSISGQLIRKGVLHSNAIDGLENGIYLVDNRKVLVR